MKDNRLKAITANIGDMALKRRVETIVNELDLKEGDKVLDCGCGDGLYLKTGFELGKYKFFGFDLNGESLRLCQRNVSDIKSPLTQGNICYLPFKDNTFDKIFSTEVLEHVPDDSAALTEIYRILKPGGKFVITVPNHNYPFLWDPVNWLMEATAKTYIKAGFWAGIWNMHLRLYKTDELVKIISSAGFKITSFAPLTHYCVPMNHIVLYGLKQVLISGILPEAVSNSADKFSNNEAKQSDVIKFGYYILNLFDKLNDNLPPHKSSVSTLVTAEKMIISGNN